MEMNKIMVIGSGQMGNGIAQVAAQAGYNVLLNDISIEYILITLILLINFSVLFH